MQKVTDFFDDMEDLELCLRDAFRQACSDFELDFTDSMNERLKQYGSRMVMSLKQANTLRRIAGWEEL